MLDEVELEDEVDEVLEGRVQVGLDFQSHHVREVRVVNVGVHPEESLEDDADDLAEVAREVDPRFLGEDRLVVDLVLHPADQVLFRISLLGFVQTTYVFQRTYLCTWRPRPSRAS